MGSAARRQRIDWGAEVCIGRGGRGGGAPAGGRCGLTTLRAAANFADEPLCCPTASRRHRRLWNELSGFPGCISAADTMADATE
jgi:hypothetical protein